MSKIIIHKNLPKTINQLKTKTIVLVGGCFDLLHPGHLAFLKAAKKQGQVLIIALESDEKIKRKKGLGRPINNQIIRAKNLAKLSFVDYIVLLPDFKKDSDYQDLVKIIKPKVIAVTENDLIIEKKRNQAEFVKAKLIVVTPYLKEYSTTKIINTNINKLKTNLN